MINYFTFDGVDSRDFNTFIATSNMFDAPEENVETIHIPYKNTPLHISEKTFKPFILKALCYIPDNMQNNIDELRNFLKSRFASCRYTEALRPGEFRMARFKSAFEVERSDRQTAAFVLTFECAPQRYIIDNPTISLSSTLSEETSYSLSTPAMPLPITLEGNTTQNTLSGKNLYNAGALTQGTTYGITLTVSGGTLTFNGTATANTYYTIRNTGYSNGTYTFSFNNPVVSTGVHISFRDTGESYFADTNADKVNKIRTFTGEPDDILLYISSGTTLSNYKITPQLEKGSSATAYEQYCGGIPSPNPDYPQEIHSVKGDNEVRVVGKNIIPITATTQTMNGVTFTVNEDGTVRANGTATTSFSFNFFYRGSGASNGIPLTAGTTYVLSTADMQNYSINLQVMRDGQPITVYCNRPFTAQEGDYVSVVWVWRQSGTLFNNALFSPQFEVGSTPTAFEPYKAQVYPINLPVENLAENHLTAQTISGLTVSVNGGVVTINGTATTTKYLQICRKTLAQYGVSAGDTLTLSGCANGGSGSTYRMGAYMHNSGGGDVQQAYDTGNGATFTIPSTANDIEIVIYIANGATINNLVFKPQLEKGSKANSYTPYGVAPIELNALGTYKDYFHKTNGKWYLHKAIGSQVGSTAPNSSGTASSGAYRYNYATVTRFKEYTEAQGGASSHFTYNINYNAPSGSFYNTGGNIIIFCDIAPADIGAWAQGNKPIFYGILATPTETEITNATLISQLNALSKAKTYDGSTTIVQEGSDAQFKLSMPVPTEVTSEYFGEPIITVSEVGTIVWNDSLIKVNSAPVTINSQTLQCYYYSENKNNDVEVNEFPKYEQGENYIGSTMALTVVPNYWKL